MRERVGVKHDEMMLFDESMAKARCATYGIYYL